MSRTTFADLGVSNAVCASLERRGITEPFPVQARVMADALAGRDVLVQSPTGSGKTFAFGIAIVDRLEADAAPHSALILVPTRELASQVAQEIAGIARARGLRVARAYGGASLREQIRYVAKAQIIVATPGRLGDLRRPRCRAPRARQDPRARRGRPHARHGLPAAGRRDRQPHPGRPPDDVLLRHAGGQDPRRAKRTRATPVATRTSRVRRRRGRSRTASCPSVGRPRRGARRPPCWRGPALAGVRAHATRRRPAGREAQARAASVPASCTATRRSRQRERALGEFASGRVKALVATDVAARGIDIDDISHVINFDPPDDADTYTHRIGRTGRAGRPGTASRSSRPSTGARSRSSSSSCSSRRSTRPRASSSSRAATPPAARVARASTAVRATGPVGSVRVPRRAAVPAAATRVPPATSHRELSSRAARAGSMLPPDTTHTTLRAPAVSTRPAASAPIGALPATSHATRPRA